MVAWGYGMKMRDLLQWSMAELPQGQNVLYLDWIHDFAQVVMLWRSSHTHVYIHTHTHVSTSKTKEV